MASLTEHQRTNAVKFLHDWENTGSQNLQFQASEMDKPAAHKTYADSHTSCPFLCGETETPLHYLYCPSTAARQSSTSFLSLIQCTLKKEHTALPVYNAIMQHLKHHLHHPSSPRQIVPTITIPSLHATITAAIAEQDTIGWQHFLKGRLSTHWSYAQQACYTQRTDLDKRKFTILRWRRRLVRSIIDGCIKCWETRNQALHGDTLQATANIRLHKLRVRVAKSYANDRLSVPPQLRTLFHMPLKDRLSHTCTQLQKWLETIQVAKKTMHLQQLQMKYDLHSSLVNTNSTSQPTVYSPPPFDISYAQPSLIRSNGYLITMLPSHLPPSPYISSSNLPGAHQGHLLPGI